ncbi:MAG: CinA family nicotinamide mononucleotide deamidase-related protein [Chromatiales bacterium]|jgi:nicotinamide-nucleotide amidase|nr:CinA family nicotinamide mononucleotide deamidase-related protein [Chromatiales bacterium]
MRIEIICTGDEVLSGKTINTNYSHMARRLQEVGLDVVWGTTIGDNRDSLKQAFALAATRVDAVIVNGGLGPTVDDLSQEIAAEAAGVGLVLHEGWLANIKSFYERRGRAMPPNNRKQAMLPDGAEFIDNPVGTACGFALDIGGARFFFTPGVPRELHKMLNDEVIPRLLAAGDGASAVMLKRFHSFGLGESRVDNALQGVEAFAAGGEVKLGFQAHYPQLETKIFARGPSDAELEARIAPVAEKVREHLGAYIVAEGKDTLEGNLVAALRDAGASLMVAECGTHGAVTARLTAVDPEGQVFKRGIVTATATGLIETLALDAAVRSAQQTVVDAAEVARRQAKTSYALAVSTPSPDTNGEAWAYIAISHNETATVTREACFIGRADRARVGGVEMGLDVMRRVLAGLNVSDLIDFERH